MEAGQVRNPLRKIERISDWLDEREASRADRKLREHYAPLVEQAENAKDWDARNQLLSEWSFESDSVLHPVYARNAEKLTAQARKYGITVPSRPSSYGEESAEWYLSSSSGDWLLKTDAEWQIRRQIRDERRSSYDEFRKWATLGFALMGFVLAVIALRGNRKQPDPCPRNYYRSDSGECVFAAPKIIGNIR
jgi:hypothetical protein